jgi:hypothetical protein
LVDVVVNNFNKEQNYDLQLHPDEPSTIAGFGSQFVLYSAAIVTKLEAIMRKYYNEGTSPTGTVKARIYNSHTGTFRDRNDYADTLISESTNAIDVEDLTAIGSTVEFIFDNVSLAAGVYFICIYTDDLVRNDGVIYVIATESAASIMGYLTFWFESEGRWGSFFEWD